MIFRSFSSGSSLASPGQLKKAESWFSKWRGFPKSVASVLSLFGLPRVGVPIYWVWLCGFSLVRLSNNSKRGALSFEGDPPKSRALDPQRGPSIQSQNSGRGSDFDKNRTRETTKHGFSVESFWKPKMGLEKLPSEAVSNGFRRIERAVLSMAQERQLSQAISSLQLRRSAAARSRSQTEAPRSTPTSTGNW